MDNRCQGFSRKCWARAMLSTVTTVIGNSPADQFLIGDILIGDEPQTEGTTPADFPQHALNQAASNQTVSYQAVSHQTVSNLAKIVAAGIFTRLNVGSDDDGHHDDENASQGIAVSGSVI